VDAFFQQKIKQFAAYNYLSYADIMSLTRDDFIIELDKHHRNVERRGTCMAMVTSLSEEIKKQHEDSE